MWTVARQLPLSMGFYKQEYWRGLGFPSSGDLPNPGIEPWSHALQTDLFKKIRDTKLPWWLRGSSVCLQCRRLGFDPWVGKIPWRRKQQPTPVLLLGKSHGWRSLVGYSPWGHKELDTTERLHFNFSLSHIGEGNGNPLQYSCLENPMDGGAWWATVHGVTKSQTQLSD